MKNNKINTHLLLVLCTIIFSICACKKKADPEPAVANKPTVTTSDVTVITQLTAVCGGNVTSDGGATVTERGVCWSTTANPTITGPKLVIGSGTGTFSSTVSGLTLGTKYYIRPMRQIAPGLPMVKKKALQRMLHLHLAYSMQEDISFTWIQQNSMAWFALKPTREPC